MAAVSPAPTETARKGVALVLQRLQAAGTAVAVSAAMGVSESTISRLKNDHLEGVLQLLAHLGIKCVPSDYRCVDREAYEFLVRSHKRVMEKAPQLIWEADD